MTFVIIGKKLEFKKMPSSVPTSFPECETPPVVNVDVSIVEPAMGGF